MAARWDRIGCRLQRIERAFRVGLSPLLDPDGGVDHEHEEDDKLLHKMAAGCYRTASAPTCCRLPLAVGTVSGTRCGGMLRLVVLAWRSGRQSYKNTLNITNYM